MENELELAEWRVEGRPVVIQYPVRLMRELGDLAMSGFRQYPWGGVEIGGVLFGGKTEDGVQIIAARPLECEHQNGPSFELSPEDERSLAALFDLAKTNEQLGNLEPVGFYHSVSHRDLALSESDKELYDKFFGAPWQIALVIKRAKSEPLRFGFFFREPDGSVQSYKSCREFTVDVDATAKEPGESMHLSQKHEPKSRSSASSSAEFGTAAARAKESAGARELFQPSLFEPDSACFEFSRTETESAGASPADVEAEVLPAPAVPELHREQGASSIVENNFETAAVEDPFSIEPDRDPTEFMAPEPSRNAFAGESEPEPAPSVFLRETGPKFVTFHERTASVHSLRQDEQAVAPHVSFLSLHQDPFLLTPDPTFLYESRQHAAAITTLKYAVHSRKGFVSLTGPTGAGKTLVLECLMDHLKQEKIEFAFVFNAKLTIPQLFELIDYDLALDSRVPSKTQVLIALNERLLRTAENGGTTALIVDDAQKLSDEMLEEIELLANLETRRGPLLQVLFSGQPEFEEKLNNPVLRGLKQRIMLRARLRPFDASETARYVNSRLAIAGAQEEFFPADVLAEIHVRTKGIPRLITAVCGALLERCYLEGSMRVTPAMLEQVSGDFELAP